MSEIRFRLNDETYTSVDFDPGTDHPVLLDIIRHESQFKVTEQLDRIFEYYMDFIYKNTEFTFYWDDQMGSEITLKTGVLASAAERELLLEIGNLMAGIKKAGPPAD